MISMPRASWRPPVVRSCDHCRAIWASRLPVLISTRIVSIFSPPRETVRRKIARLVELDWVCRKDNGHLFLSFNALQHYGNVLSSRDLNDVLDTADRVRRALEQATTGK